jgi:hypothetical protein
MSIPAEVVELVERFERNYKSYLAPNYNEEQLRIEFVNPFFKALGWDMSNEAGFAEQYKDVIHEDALKMGGTTKSPDYCFRIGGVRKFYLETKKPGVNIVLEPGPAFQLRRYAYTANLPLSILTNFRDLAVYDGRIQPDKKDAPKKALLQSINYLDYAENWDWIEKLFSRQGILKGAFDLYATEKTRRGTATFDVAFLREIEGWRDVLARHIAARNTVSESDLNLAVGRIIDRIIFLRICEERGIEPKNPLMALRNGVNTYKRLVELFERADERYNSGLFHFKPDAARHEEPDEITPTLKIDNTPIKDVLSRLYYPDSPYAFNVMPLEILGQIYEQFLGKVIRVQGKGAVVEEKPEVKKAGGVYYTPSYIVDHIVQKTVGALCEGKTPAQVAKLKFLDPACGSGSFLLGVYDFLLRWHLDWYGQNDPAKHAKGKNPAVFQSADSYQLTPRERKRIVRDNIFGVDIDRQAVEVTKLSLLLKVLEGESDESISSQLRLLKERALPDLGDNIKCGNSLIAPDFEFDDDGNPRTISDEERRRVNAFDWRIQYSNVFKNGGFDAIFGNPPYVRIQALKEWAPLEAELLKSAYTSASQGNYDLYVVFIERALSLLNPNGRFGFILPHKFFNAQYGEKTRELLSKGAHVSEVVNFGDQQVFSTATTYTCLLFASRAANEQVQVSRVDDLLAWQTSGAATSGEVPSSSLSSVEWNFAVGNNAALFEKLNQMPVKLGAVAQRMAQGIRTSANEVYVLDLVEDNGKLIKAHSKQLDKAVVLERDSVALFLQGREIKPYRVLHSGKVVVLPYKISEKRSRFIAETEMQKSFPNTFAYLLENKSYLEEREKGRFRGAQWYVYGRPQNIDLMMLPKILVPDIADRASFALDENGDYAFTSGYGITLKETVAESSHYVLGLLNSKVLNRYLRSVSTPMRGGFFRYFTQFIEQLPIRVIDFSDKADKARHDTLVKLVERMLELHQQLGAAKTVAARTSLQNQIAATDRQIDKLVYALYDLTEEEIALVEGSE